MFFLRDLFFISFDNNLVILSSRRDYITYRILNINRISREFLNLKTIKEYNNLVILKDFLKLIIRKKA